MNLMITGATGQLGSTILDILSKEYQGKLIAGSRDPQKIRNPRVEKRQVDFDRPEILTQSFKDIEKLLIISTDALATPGLRLKQHLQAKYHRRP